MPFSSPKAKRDGVKHIKNSIELSRKEFNKVKENDSLLYELSVSVEDTVNVNLIKKRLDLFYNGVYSARQARSALMLDRVGITSFEFVHDSVDTSNFIKLNTIGDMKEYVKMTDSSIRRSFDVHNIKVVRDSAKHKKDSIKNDN